MTLQENFTPRQVAGFIRKVDPKFHDPSPEQEAIISIVTNPLEPAVVVAGAGSGKTETMAARVVYLVANGFVTPDQILGLTFTKKAAGELNARVRKRLKQLTQGMKESGVTPSFTTFDATVMTYHAYAGNLLSTNAIRLGIDADSRPLSEAHSWMLARSIVENWNETEFSSEDGLDSVVGQVMSLASAMLEHDVTAAQITAEDQRLVEKLQSLDKKMNQKSADVIAVAQQRQAILPMVERYLEKRREGAQLSFEDHIAFVGVIAAHFPDVAERERNQYKVVLLDEYQDTSHSQIRFLSTLFGAGHPVTAVGDPYQSIYTWRGAASGTIGAFNKDFPKVAGQIGSAMFNLSTTYRNDQAILDVANAISARIADSMAIAVPPLSVRHGAGAGEIACGIFETRDNESIAIAEYFAPLWKESRTQNAHKRTFAVLVRTRRLIPSIAGALDAFEIPYEVIGLSGLIHVPEIADIIAILRILESPDAGSAVMRHLTGPRINLGARDLAALGRFTRSLSEKEATDSRSIVANIINGNPASLEADDIDSGSIIIALDEIEKAPASEFSTAGYARLIQFAADLRRLRARASAPLVDLILEIERYLNLEVEVALRESHRGGRRHLDKFLDEASQFARTGGSLTGFINWLDASSSREQGLKMSAPEPNPDVVQILTIHTAKGAEWDVVAIPGLNTKTFPSDVSRGLENWLSNEGTLPFPLYRNPMPSHGLENISEYPEAAKKIDDFKDACKAERMNEERRLGYVAVTRARTHLLCTAAYWADGTNVLTKSELYQWIEEVAAKSGRIIDGCDEPTEAKQDISQLERFTGTWPRDPLGAGRAAFDAKVAKVSSATPVDLAQYRASSDEAQSWIEDARAIVTELKESQSSLIEIPRPSRMSPSAIIAMKKNPEEFAKAIRRPMPRARDQYSDRGTAFHLWVEKHLTGAQLFDDGDFDLLAPIEEDRTLEQLKEKWLASEYGSKTVHQVEVPFETMIAGVLVRGRIDAIYKTDTGFEVVDWKTGSRTLDDDSAIQLAIYRLAWAKLAEVPIESVSAAFHYVPTSITDRRANLKSEAELIQLLESPIDTGK